MPTTRKINTPKKLSAKAALAASTALPAPVVLAPVTVPATVTDTAPVAAKPVGSITRTAATIVAARCNFGGLTDRDAAYIAFFASFTKRANKPSVTLAEIRETAARPDYSGSAKAYDAGVIQRLTKAGLIKHSTDGTSFEFVDGAKTHAAYARAVARG